MANKNLGKVGISARGGGYKVAFTVGVCKYLGSLGIEVSLVSAVSSSALTLGAWIADGFKTDRLEEENKKIDALGDNFAFDKRYMQYIKMAWHLKENSLFSNDGLRAIINGKKELGLTGIDIKNLLASRTEMRIAIHNETEAKKEFVSNRDAQFKDDYKKMQLYLQATASPMGVFPPVKIGECFYSDGMYPDLECVIQSGCDTIFIIDNDMPPVPHLETLSCLRRFLYNVSVMHDDEAEKDIARILKLYPDFILIERNTETPWIKRCYKYFKSIAASAKRGDDVNLVPHRIIVLSPEKTIGKLGTIEFSKGDLIAATQHGYECAEKAIQNL